jgi:hypothetical protein
MPGPARRRYDMKAAVMEAIRQPLVVATVGVTVIDRYGS